jgi:hypothetical protein
MADSREVEQLTTFTFCHKYRLWRIDNLGAGDNISCKNGEHYTVIG